MIGESKNEDFVTVRAKQYEGSFRAFLSLLNFQMLLYNACCSGFRRYYYEHPGCFLKKKVHCLVILSTFPLIKAATICRIELT